MLFCIKSTFGFFFLIHTLIFSPCHAFTTAASAFEKWQACAPSNQHREREGNSTQRLIMLCPQMWQESSSMQEDRGLTHREWPLLLPGQENDPATSFLLPVSTAHYCTPPNSTKIYQAMDKTDKRGALKATFWKASNLKGLTFFVWFGFLRFFVIFSIF